jgi:hypothetical protein
MTALGKVLVTSKLPLAGVLLFYLLYVPENLLGVIYFTMQVLLSGGMMIKAKLHAANSCYSVLKKHLISKLVTTPVLTF